MLIRLLAISLVYVHYAQSIMTAVAKIHLDSKDGFTGFFIFAQMNENSPVIIKGSIWNMPPNTVHVSSNCSTLLIVTLSTTIGPSCT